MSASIEISKSQRLLVIGLLCATFLLTFVSQIIGIALALFCLFLARRLRHGWSESRGTLHLPDYIKAIGTASIRFYGYCLLTLLFLLSHLESSAMSTNSTLDVSSVEFTDGVLVGITFLTTFLLLFVSTLLRIGLGLNANKAEMDGGFITTIIATATTVTRWLSATFSKKRSSPATDA